MELRKLKLKEQYRSDRDDIISEFFVPCLSNCIQYDRTVEFVTLGGLTTLSLGFHNATPNARTRIITGHQFAISDLNSDDLPETGYPQNATIESEADNLLDFSESNPFGNV